MPSFNPFTSVTGKNSFTLFQIRLDNDFIVFRGSEQESSGQLLRGTVVLCLPAALKVEAVHLRLIGTLRLSWIDSRVTPTGISNHKVDKSVNILSHKWPPFAGVGAAAATDSGAASLGTRPGTLPAGNYEWPFEFMLPGDTTESVEGMAQASITYKLKATVVRGKLAYDLHAYKRLRVIRSLDPAALEYLHAMSVENIWPNKIEYSIVVPQKAVVFGTAIPLETRFTPLLKGLDLGDLTVKLVEVHDIVCQAAGLYAHGPSREHKKEREIRTWTIPLSKDDHWQDMIDDSGQEGWVMNTHLDLPRTLGKCMQDVNAQGIRIRHKLKLVVALKNPDGHISELRATLPVTIFISPNVPLDEDGNLVHRPPHGATTTEMDTGGAPPGYGQHVLDQLYEDVDMAGLQTPALQSGVNSPSLTPSLTLSRAGSSENLAGLVNSAAITPAALVSRLQSVSLDASRRNQSWNSLNGLAAGWSSGTASPQHPYHAPRHTRAISDGCHAALQQQQSNPLTRQSSDESGVTTPEHVDHASDLEGLSKVPSYGTAIKTPVRPLSFGEAFPLPNYQTAVTNNSAPASPGVATDGIGSPLDSFSPITETPSAGTGTTESTSGSHGPPSVPASREPSPNGRPPRPGWRRQSSLGFSLPSLHHLPHIHHGSHHSSHQQQHHGHHHRHQSGHTDDERRRMMFPQVRERVA